MKTLLIIATCLSLEPCEHTEGSFAVFDYDGDYNGAYIGEIHLTFAPDQAPIVGTEYLMKVQILAIEGAGRGTHRLFGKIQKIKKLA